MDSTEYDRKLRAAAEVLHAFIGYPWKGFPYDELNTAYQVKLEIAAMAIVDAYLADQI